MILSFHPCFWGNHNILCAGREPDQDDLAAIRSAHAVILPQGCKASLYRIAKDNCPHVFPNYDAKFRYPGKIGQAQLFREIGVPHPHTEIYPCVDDYFKHNGYMIPTPSVGFPFVFKYDWGGEGDNVFLIRALGELRNALEKASEFERTGQKGFVIQQYIPNGNRTLRITIIGSRFISYWRVQKNVELFHSNLDKGGMIDPFADPHLQEAAIGVTRDFCRIAGINLAGFDFLFSSRHHPEIPLFLEINYFFGRRGLGGSDEYYRILIEEILLWIRGLGYECPAQLEICEE